MSLESRRDVLRLFAYGATTLAGCSSAPSEQPARDALLLGGATTSLPDEHDEMAQIEGSMPRELKGTLYRNGPGLFERAGVRKRCLVDGDGMIRGYTFDGTGGMRFRNRFVRTKKYLDEHSAGKYLYDTWTTKAPGVGGGLPNILNQAGVSVRPNAGKLYAFDEAHLPYEIDATTLGTIGEATLGVDPMKVRLQAHAKKLGKNGDWLHVGVLFGPTPAILFVAIDASGKVIEQRSHPMDPAPYLHDWFATENWYVVHVHPAFLDLLPLLKGSSFRDSLQWKPEKGSRFLLFERNKTDPPIEIAAEPRWMWHTAAAYEDNGKLVLHWIAYDKPDNFFGDTAEVCAVMNGEMVPASPGYMRRTTIDPAKKTIADERLAQPGDQDLPIINPARIGRVARYCYSAWAPGSASVLWSGVARVDLTNGASVTFDHGPKVVACEPVFVPKPGKTYDGTSASEPGWLLQETTDAVTGRGALAILDAERIGDGPIARARLPHHLPLSFHGEFIAS